MRVLHITTIDTGGAYKAAYRLHEMMLLQGIDSKIMVRTKLYPNNQVLETFYRPIEAFFSKVKNGINRLMARGKIADDRFGTDISKLEQVKEADVIIIHWINSFLSQKDIVKLGKLGKRILWVMHDMWLFTGGCHVDGYCGGYARHCGNCPLIGGKREEDLSRRNFLSKMKMMEQIEVTVLGPSQWIVEQARKSEIVKNKKVRFVPNTLNTLVYRPVSGVEKKKLRNQYGIPENKKIILFGAADDGTRNENKGFRYLRDAISYLQAEEYCLIIFGNTAGNLGLPTTLEVIKMGYIFEEKVIIELYQLADVLVNPSSQESFGYTVCEAMACGIPVVGFPIGGIKEQIRHRENGYLAKYHDAKELAQGISYCAAHTVELGQKACISAQKYSYENIGKIYGEILYGSD